MKIIFILFFFCSCLFFFSCSEPEQTYQEFNVLPDIFPDYKEVTVPVNIAPLNFRCRDTLSEATLLIEGKGEPVKISSATGKFVIPKKKWKRLLDLNKNGKIWLTVFEKKKGSRVKYKPFSITISPEPIDPYLVYRLIEPGYATWYKMGIYQRNIEGDQESAIYENRVSNYNCVNCHSFCMQNPGQMLFHIRGGKNSGSVLIENGKIEKLDTKSDSTNTPLVYPAWHPSGKFIAFSVNKTQQAFYSNNKDRIEVFDSRSDVVVYDLELQKILISPLLCSKEAFETFPAFSPDGKTLYFCTARAVVMPEEIDSVRYNLCAISFDPITKTFGEKVDTIFNAENMDKSVALPRVSPDGKFLLFTLADFGNFHIWHKSADLYLMNLGTGKFADMRQVNSNDVESYHSWSSNSRWFVFSSRRIDGLYTRPFIAYLDKNGNLGKPFLLPQKDPDYYNWLMKSLNIPEFTKGKVITNSHEIVQQTKL